MGDAFNGARSESVDRGHSILSRSRTRYVDSREAGMTAPLETWEGILDPDWQEQGSEALVESAWKPAMPARLLSIRQQGALERQRTGMSGGARLQIAPQLYSSYDANHMPDNLLMYLYPTVSYTTSNCRSPDANYSVRMMRCAFIWQNVNPGIMLVHGPQASHSLTSKD